MPELRPAYLIHGDDHGAIAERRARLRRLAEREGGAAGVEALEGDTATPSAVAQALAAMTIATGRRVIIVDGAEHFRDAEVQSALAPAMSDLPPDTTVAFFAREDARVKAPPSLHKAVRDADGQVAAESSVKPWELPAWVREQAARMGVRMDAAAAKALVAHVGERQQRLLRELEKLALEHDEGAPLSADDVDRFAARSAQWRAFSLADALVAADAPAATLHYLRLRAQGERLTGLLYVLVQRLREALSVSERLEHGVPAAEVRRGLRMPQRAAERFIADVARTDPERLRRALYVLADLELDTRGGAPVAADRSPLAGLQEDTLAVAAIAEVAGVAR